MCKRDNSVIMGAISYMMVEVIMLVLYMNSWMKRNRNCSFYSFVDLLLTLLSTLIYSIHHTKEFILIIIQDSLTVHFSNSSAHDFVRKLCIFVAHRYFCCQWKTWMYPNWHQLIYHSSMELCLTCFLVLRHPVLTIQ